MMPPATSPRGNGIVRPGSRHDPLAAGFDAPEVDHGETEHEVKIGMAAAERLVQLLSEPNEVRMERLPEPDHHGRTLARLYVNNRDVAEIAIEEGWGVPMPNRRRRSSEMPDWSKTQYPR